MRYKLWSKKVQEVLHLLLDIYSKPIGTYEYDVCPLCATVRRNRKENSFSCCQKCPWVIVTGQECTDWHNNIGDLRWYKCFNTAKKANSYIRNAGYLKQEMTQLLIRRIKMLQTWIAIWETANIHGDIDTAKASIEAQKFMQQKGLL